MAVYMRELDDLEQFISLARSVTRNEWQSWLKEADKPRQLQGSAVSELLGRVQDLGPAHLEAIREFKRKEQNKGCLPEYFRGFFPS